MAYSAIDACQSNPPAVSASRDLTFINRGQYPRINLFCKGMAEKVWRYVLSIRQVHAGRSAPSTAYLAVDAAHGLYAAFYAYHGSPHCINLGFLVVHRTSTSRENHRFHQIPEILILLWLLPYTIMVEPPISSSSRNNSFTLVVSLYFNGAHYGFKRAQPTCYYHSEQPFEGIQGITDRVGDVSARLVR
eukprot:4510-Pleurochrysis_carterae.AAC.1